MAKRWNMYDVLTVVSDMGVATTIEVLDKMETEVHHIDSNHQLYRPMQNQLKQLVREGYLNTRHYPRSGITIYWLTERGSSWVDIPF